MPRRTGTSCLFSALIVGLVGFALYRPDSPAPARMAAASPIISADSVAEATPPARPPAPTPGVPWAPSPVADRVAPSPPATAATPGRSSTPGTSRLPHRPGFAAVQDGERLSDIARRIYGNDSAIEPIWQANRDQLPCIESPLRAGMLLRTP